MHWEVEQKFPAADLEAVRACLMDLGASFEPAIEQADLYFAHPARDFAKTDEALRLRRVGDANFITYKGPRIDQQTKTRKELELPLASGAAALQQFAEMLVELGFSRVATVRKTREPGVLSFEGLNVVVALDRVHGLNSFVELEVSADDESLPQARQAVAALAERLKLGASERRSYLEMLLENLV